MNEIEKMYENAGVKKINMHQAEIDNGDPRFTGISHSDSYIKYPPFTAEKQLAIENIIFQCNFGVCELQRTMPAELTKENIFVKHYFSWEYHAGDIGYYDEIAEEPYGDWYVEYSNPNREEALAGFVNALWNEYLTEGEKQQVKGILE